MCYCYMHKKLFLQVQDEPTAPTPPPRIKSLEEKNKCMYFFLDFYFLFMSRMISIL